MCEVCERTMETQEPEPEEDAYQAFCVSRMAMDQSEAVTLLTLGCGIAGESGEVADIIKKEYGHGHGRDEATRQKMLKELGDAQWYIATIAHQYGFLLSEVMEANVAKLTARYPAGFSTEDSLARRDVVSSQT